MAPSAYIPQHLRQLVAERAEFRCEYCQLQQDLYSETFKVDHIIPRALGGQTASDHLCYACPVCHNAKRSHITARDPQTGRAYDCLTLDGKVGTNLAAGVTLADVPWAKRS